MERAGSFRISFIQSREFIEVDVDSSPFFSLLHVLRIMLSELQAGTFLMRDVIGITRVPVFREFKTFL